MIDFREHWSQFEQNLEMFSEDVRVFLNKKFHPQKLQNVIPLKEDASFDDYIHWGKEYVEDLKQKANGERVNKVKEDFFSIVRALGVNDTLLRDTFAANKKEILDPLVGELVAIVTLILGWSKKDKEQFSKALGEIGVLGIFTAKPFICLIAVCGLAYGYNRSFHQEAFKKGGVIGIAGLGAAWLGPGGFVGLLAALIVIIYLNKKLKTDRPVEVQVKEIFKRIKEGDFIKEVRHSWESFEDFLGKLFYHPVD